MVWIHDRIKAIAGPGAVPNAGPLQTYNQHIKFSTSTNCGPPKLQARLLQHPWHPLNVALSGLRSRRITIHSRGDALGTSSETSLSRQFIAPVLTTKYKESNCTHSKNIKSKQKNLPHSYHNKLSPGLPYSLRPLARKSSGPILMSV